LSFLAEFATIETANPRTESCTLSFFRKEIAILAITVEIPGIGTVEYHHAVFDLNGTLATDGRISETMAISLQELATLLDVHILTAGTHGGVEVIEGITGIKPVLIKTGEDKARFVRALHHVIAVGNGAVDTFMLNAADLSIGVIGDEGAYTKTLMASDVVVQNGQDAIDLLRYPKRLIATLRL
jgi:soluble P-type ATPase